MASFVSLELATRIADHDSVSLHHTTALLNAQHIPVHNHSFLLRESIVVSSRRSHRLGNILKIPLKIAFFCETKNRTRDVEIGSGISVNV